MNLDMMLWIFFLLHFIRCVATAVDAATVITVDDIPFHRHHLLYRTK